MSNLMVEASRSLTSTGYSHYGHTKTVSAFLEEGIATDNPDITYNLGNDIILEMA